MIQPNPADEQAAVLDTATIPILGERKAPVFLALDGLRRLDVRPTFLDGLQPALCAFEHAHGNILPEMAMDGGQRGILFGELARELIQRGAVHVGAVLAGLLALSVGLMLLLQLHHQPIAQPVQWIQMPFDQLLLVLRPRVERKR